MATASHIGDHTIGFDFACATMPQILQNLRISRNGRIERRLRVIKGYEKPFGGSGGQGEPKIVRCFDVWPAHNVMPGRFRKPVFDVVPSVIPANVRPVQRIVLHEDTWERHILIGHPELIGREQLVEEVVTHPTAIYSSNVLTADYLFVNSRVTDSAGRLLRVVVRAGIVVSAYYTSATGGRRIWP